MRVSLRWLAEYVDIDLPLKELALQHPSLKAGASRRKWTRRGHESLSALAV
jgi:hypothetical protein